MARCWINQIDDFFQGNRFLTQLFKELYSKFKLYSKLLKLLTYFGYLGDCLPVPNKKKKIEGSISLETKCWSNTISPRMNSAFYRCCMCLQHTS